MRAIPNGRRIVPRLKRCWELFKGFICLSSLWDSNFTVISLLYQPYNSASYLCWTCRPISMTSFCLNFRNLPENDRTMSDKYGLCTSQTRHSGSVSYHERLTMRRMVVVLFLRLPNGTVLNCQVGVG